MAQHDYVIANGTGAAVRSDLNNALASIVSQNSGATEPATMFAYQWWADTTTGLLKQRNAANNAWVTIGTLASTNLGLLASGGTLTSALGSASTPGITFTGDTNTGIYSPGADQVAVATGGTGRLFIDSSGRVGLGTSSPTDSLQVGPSTGTTGYSFFVTTPAVNAGSGSGFKVSGTYASTLSLVNVDAIGVNSGGYGSALAFRTTLETSGPVERMRIDSQGRVGIGVTGPSSILDINGDLQQRNGSGVTLGKVENASGWYSLTGDASNVNGAQLSHSTAVRFLTASNERARIDSSGRLLVGTSSSILSYANLQVTGGSDNAGHVCLANGGTAPVNGANIGSIRFTNSAGGIGAQFNCEADGAWTAGSNYRSRLVFSTTADGASSPTERMRITNGGNIAINCTGLTNDAPNVAGGFYTSTNGNMKVRVNSDGVSAFQFYSPTGGTSAPVGSIIVNASSTSYSTSSDYRLKENVVPLTGAADRVNQLQVHRFNFIANPNKTVDGFIAHEAQTVVPECVTGEKDAVDDNGNPVYQGIDQSKLVPLLTAALQEALQKIEDLEGRLTAAGL